MAQSTPTHASGFHLVTVAMTGHAKDKGSTTIAHSSLKRCCLNAVNESRSENMGLYPYDQWGCLPSTSEDNIESSSVSMITSSVSRLSRGDKYRQQRKKHNQCNAQYDA